MSLKSGKADVLSAKQRSLMQTVAEILIPQGGPFLAGAADVDVLGQVEQLLARVPAESRLGVKLALFIIEHFGGIFIWRFVRFSRAERPEQERILRALHDHRVYAVRGIFMGLNAMLQMSFYGDESVELAVGYKRPQTPLLKTDSESARRGA